MRKFLISMLFLIAASAQADTLQTATLAVNAMDVAWDSTRSLFFVSVASNDPAYPSSVVLVDPETAQITDSISIVDSPDHIAVSSDGQYLYVGIDSLGVVRRYHLPSHTPDFDIPFGNSPEPGYPPGIALSIMPLAGQSTSFLVAEFYFGGVPGFPVGQAPQLNYAVFDGAVARAGSSTSPVGFGQEPPTTISIYQRPSDNQIFACDGVRIYWLSLTLSGLSASRVAWYGYGAVHWSEHYATGANGSVFNLDLGTVTGQMVLPPIGNAGTPGGGTAGFGGGAVTSSTATLDPTESFMIGLLWDVYGNESLSTFSLADYKPVETVSLGNTLYEEIQFSLSTRLLTWGTDGILISAESDLGDPIYLIFAHTSTALAPVTPVPVPAPQVDSAGAIHIALAAGGLVYDSTRNLIWADIVGNQGVAGNSIVSIDPSTGNVGMPIPVGSEPGPLALTDDGQTLFTASTGAPLIVPVNLQTGQAGLPIVTADQPSPTQPTSGAYWFAESLATLPGQTYPVVAIRYFPKYGQASRSTVAYDSTGPRPQTISNQELEYIVDYIFRGDANNAFFAIDGYDTNHSLYRFLIGATGVTVDKQLNSINTSFPRTGAYGNGKLFGWNGGVFTSDTTKQLGSIPIGYGFPLTFSDPNLVAWVSSTGSPFFIGFWDPNDFWLVSYASALTGGDYVALSAVAVGSDTVAFSTSTEIIIVPPSARIPILRRHVPVNQPK